MILPVIYITFKTTFLSLPTSCGSCVFEVGPCAETSQLDSRTWRPPQI